MIVSRKRKKEKRDVPGDIAEIGFTAAFTFHNQQQSKPEAVFCRFFRMSIVYFCI